MKQVHSSSASTWFTDIIFLSLLIGLFFWLGLGARPLFVPDEGRYAEIAREMIVRHDYVTPYLNGIKYFEKPPFFYWMEVAAIKIGGLNLWSIRSVNAFLALFGCVITYTTARSIYNRSTGLVAAFILATSCLYFVMTHMVSLDLPVTVFLSATLYAFILGTRHRQLKIAHRYFILAAAMAAIAVLTKGLIGIVFPGMIATVWLVTNNQWRVLKRIPFISCIIVFLIIAAPWHYLVGQRNPEFFYFYFVEQHILRYTNMEIGHYQPAWFFIPTLIVGFFPWIVFLPQAIIKQWPGVWKSKTTTSADVFFMLWAAIVFVFFSFSKSKLIPYILPVFPPIAILTAHYLTMAMKHKPSPGVKAGLCVLVIFATYIGYMFIKFSHSEGLPNPAEAYYWLSKAAAILIIGSVIATYYAWRNTCHAVIALVITSLLFLATLFTAIPAIDTRTILPLATTLKPLLKPNDIVVTYDQYYQDLPFYLERTVSVLNWRNELTFGMEHQDNHDWLINDATLLQQWQSKRRVFIVMSLTEYEGFKHDKRIHNIHVIDKTTKNILISNR